MNIQTLKYEIIEWVTRTNDNSLLKTLKLIKDSNLSVDNWFENLSKEEKESINNGISDHKQGTTLTSKEFWSGYEDKI